MATAATLFQHQLTAGQALSPALSPMDSSTPTSGSNGTSGSDGSDSSSATISANDFLTLLVTEMQNQDPTANTDPNEYINQLVQVNSLEQLIDINQTLGGAFGSTSDPGSSTTDPTGSSNPSTQAIAGAPANPSHGTNPLSSLGAASGQNASANTWANATAAKSGSIGIAASHLAHGNLSVPAANSSAQRVGHALDGRVRTSAPATGNL